MTTEQLVQEPQELQSTNGIFVTQSMRDALAMVLATQRHRSNRVGLILGQPGTGKTIASHWLLGQNPQSCRICCHSGMSKRQFAVELATAVGYPGGKQLSYDGTMSWLSQNVNERLFIIDEANHLHWPHIEALRFLTDEAGATAILVGTELLSQTLMDRRIATYLAQMNSRIGSKTIVFKPIPDDDMGLVQVKAYFLAPRFGLTKPKQSVARAFLKACKGNWRLGNELADACERLLKTQGFTELTTDVVNAAAVHLANALNT